VATRRERVILDLEDNLSPGLARAAVTSRVLKGELNDLGRDSTRAGRALDDVGDGAKRTGRNTNSAARDIDRFSGRLRLLLDTALILGPTLAPIGAGLVPLLTGGAAALGVTAAAAGTAALAFTGLGDAIGALNDYQLAPTEENLAKVRLEMDRIGPSGERFVNFLDSIEPELRSLQMAARDGLLPGVEEGIASLLTDLPQIRELVSSVAEAMGRLSADAGADLAGNDWRGFFEYLQTDAAPTLEQLGRTLGNFAQGFANLLVGMAPATRDFTGGLEDLSIRFAEWSDGLENNEDFAAFLEYVRESGPLVRDFAAGLVGAGAALGQAMAPVGSTILPLLTEVLRLVQMLAQSPIGSTLVGAAAGFAALNRALSITDRSLTRIAPNSERTTAAMDGLSRAGSAAAAVLVLNHALSQVIKSTDDAAPAVQQLTQDLLNLDQADTLNSIGKSFGDIGAALDELADPGLANSIGNLYDKVPGGGTFANWVPGLAEARQDAREAVADFEALDAALAGLVAQGAEEEAANAVAKLADAYGLTAEQQATLLEQLPQYREALAAAATAEDLAGSGADSHAAAVERQTAALQRNIEAMRAKREEALSAYDAETRWGQAVSDARAAVAEGRKGLSKFTEQGRANRQMLSDLASAWNNSSDAVKNNLDRYRAARKTFIDTAEAMGLSRDEARRLANELMEVGKTDVKPAVKIDLDPLRSGIATVKSWLGDIPDEHVKVYIDRVGSMGGPGRDRVATGAPRMGSSRTVGRMQIAASTGLPVMGRGAVDVSADKAALFLDALKGAAGEAAGSLAGLNQKLKAAEKAVERERRQRDALVSMREATRSAILNDLSADYFALSEGSGNPWAAGATAGGVMDPLAVAQERRDRAKRFIEAIRTLKSKGLRKAAIDVIISEGLEAAEFMAAQSQAYLNEFTATVAEGDQYAAQAANMGAQAVVSNAELKVANAELREANKRLHRIEKAIDRADKNNQTAQANGANQAFQAANRPAANARRRARV
jgi:hypothetical protein